MDRHRPFEGEIIGWTPESLVPRRVKSLAGAADRQRQILESRTIANVYVMSSQLQYIIPSALPSRGGQCGWGPETPEKNGIPIGI